jgi:hypothetical protein
VALSTRAAAEPAEAVVRAWGGKRRTTAGIGAIEQMLYEDARELAGAPHHRGGRRVGHRWGRTKGMATSWGGGPHLEVMAKGFASNARCKGHISRHPPEGQLVVHVALADHQS